MKLTLWISILSLSFFASCDCLQSVQGKMVDANTGYVIVGVVVRSENDGTDLKDQSKNLAITKSNGVFNIDRMASAVIGCPDVELHFFKEGYLPAKIIVPHFTTRKVIKMFPAQ